MKISFRISFCIDLIQSKINEYLLGFHFSRGEKAFGLFEALDGFETGGFQGIAYGLNRVWREIEPEVSFFLKMLIYTIFKKSDYVLPGLLRPALIESK